MKEYTIIKLDSSCFNDGAYTDFLNNINNEQLTIEKVTTYIEQNSVVHFDLVDIASRYFVMLLSGENAKSKVNKLANDFNRLSTDEISKIYVSSDDSLETDAKKYFNQSLKEIIFKLNSANNADKALEQTLAIIKPDGMAHKREIISMITDSGLIIKKYKVASLNEEILKEHYADLLNTPFYPQLEEYMLSGPVVILIIEGENAVKRLRDLIGPTDSRKASPNTIRGKFGTNMRLNAIHASDSIENARIEIRRFFDQKQKIKYLGLK